MACTWETGCPGQEALAFLVPCLGQPALELALRNPVVSCGGCRASSLVLGASAVEYTEDTEAHMPLAAIASCPCQGASLVAKAAPHRGKEASASDQLSLGLKWAWWLCSLQGYARGEVFCHLDPCLPRGHWAWDVR